MGKTLDLEGKTFNRITVIRRAGRTNAGKAKWFCLCSCGTEFVAVGVDIKNGRIKSCGCYQREMINWSVKKHGKSKSNLYSVWTGMKQRCFNKKERCYKYYGGKGVTVCDEWLHDFEAFFNWANENGYKEGLTIDRIDVNGNYCPENCRWITIQEQMLNRTDNRWITYNGETKSLVQWSKDLGINISTLHARLGRGLTIEEAFESGKIKYGRLITYNGKTQCLQDWERETGINAHTIKERLNRNWSIEDALCKKVIDQSVMLSFNGETMCVADWSRKTGIAYPTIMQRLYMGWSPEKTLTTPVQKRKKSTKEAE